MPDHQMHPNSLEAWRSLDLPPRKAAILEAIADTGSPMTDRAICHKPGSADMNYARPAITHLIQDGLLFEVGSAKCPVTDRTVRLVYTRNIET